MPARRTHGRRFEGRGALITGAGSGIGRAVAEGFCRDGGRVVLMGRDAAKLDAVAAALPAGAAVAAPGDHADPDAAARVVATALTALGRIDFLFNNAGTFDPAPLADTSDAQWASALAANLTGPFLMSRAVLPHMRAAGRGVVVHNASTLGLRPIAGAASYCATKAGLVMLGQAMALEEAPHGVRVTSVCPGVVDTPIHTQRPGVHAGNLGDFLGQMAPLHPLGRIGTPDDVAALVLFLASDEASWMTGSVVTVDGGIALA